MNILALISDAFGGRGGIAKFNRDLLRALCSHPDCEEVVAVPRVVPGDPGSLPENLTYDIRAANSKLRFLSSAAQLTFRRSNISTFNAVICGHLYLLPMAVLAARWQRAPLLLVIHGLEARDPTPKILSNALVSQIDRFVSVSEYTKQQFIDWTGLPEEKGTVIPNCINLSEFTPGPRPDYLLDRYGLRNRTVLLTLSRLPAQALKKGHDEVLEVLPALADEIPDISYVIAGEGDDRPRLEEKAAALGLQDRVIFTGYIPEEEKIDHYRLADAFVMPGRTEGFGIVYLEAMACGAPVVASFADASVEAVRDGMLGEVVNPSDPEDIKRGIRAALAAERGVPEGLDYFSSERFTDRWHTECDSLLKPEESHCRDAEKAEVFAGG